MEQLMLQRRAKMQWLKGGDQCTKIFFCKVAAWQTTLRVFQINNAHGEMLSFPKDIQDEFAQFYEELHGGTCQRTMINLEYLRPWAKHLIMDEQGMEMLKLVRRTEIKAVFF
ncbi:UNVERIFIED_CONTAM: hypothetical protein Sangu_2242100 [Sesamum angustifolium]|uniref:Uncharacterized protein n=1 Tax=Sesamum angustifolium TaxID=2727405 RepID=A0AAW2L5X9_9LAMI